MAKRRGAAATDEQLPAEKLIFDKLKDAVRAQMANLQSKPDDKRRLYRVKHSDGDRYVISTSPAQAVLEMIGGANVALVTLKERHDAAMAALMEVQS